MAEIGSTLRETRMRARIDIGEVEAKTKIRAKYLRAIENEEWDLLPGPVYVKSFLRTYSDYLGLDSRLLIDEYKRRYERPADHDSHPIAAIIRERERDARGPLMPSWAIIGMVLAVVAVALYFVGTLGRHSSPPKTPTTTAPTASTVHNARHHHPKHRTPTITLPTRTTRPATATLKLVATGRVYVCVVDGAGKKLIPGLTYDVGGEPIPTVSSSKLMITLGNASVQMTADGNRYTVKPAPGAIALEVLPTGVKPLTTGPNC